VSAVDKYNNTALHLACAAEGGDLETVTILLQKAEGDITNLVNAANENQQTPIHLAANKGKK
jgi:ankyrin repeat protein